jgi:hypothetical protein
VVSGFHTNFQQYSHQYGLGLLTRLLTHYLRWFHNRSTMTLVPSVSQRLELERRHFERLALLSEGSTASCFTLQTLERPARAMGIGETTSRSFMSGAWPRKKPGLLKRCFDTLAAVIHSAT